MSPIFNTAGTSPAGEAFATGAMPGEGTYFCLVCGTQVSLHETDELPGCARCGASRFRRDSIFSSLQDHGSPTLEFALAREPEPPPWLEEARTRLAGPGYHLAIRERGEIQTFALPAGWVRIGRCATAQICLDDPSVSRRHAIVNNNEGRSPRVLDDRSLNGIVVNGHRVDVAELEPGDELTIGRLHLYLLHA
ncbi:MAG TPA: FHA domain-containing protein [Solirubrobacterales bacterium]|nr:FHA domain-containing protein [Solirubrobacterales bacterium]